MESKARGGEVFFLRHGQSVWNAMGLFTGWVDVNLTKVGIEEAQKAGSGWNGGGIDGCFVSSLSRAQTTAAIFLAYAQPGVTALYCDHEDAREAGKSPLHGRMHQDTEMLGSTEIAGPIILYEDERLNERCYGDLQGLSKAWAQDHFGAEQVKRWRRGYEISPPGGESLAMTRARAWSCFEERIIPQLREGKRLLICAHGNTLRALVMQLEELPAEKVREIEIPTGKVSYGYGLEEGDSWRKLKLP